MMEWKNLLSDKRFRERSKRDPLDARNPFEDDFSRIVFSSAFRRLQDKTQVFPLERDSLVRTRLTHSMEVSNIGRSIGLSVERKLVKDAKLSEEHRGHIPSILAVAGLVHDLGNPPYGHYGEEAFRKFYGCKREALKELGLSEGQLRDLTFFDGNVQTFRYLTKLHYLKDEFSYNLSFPTLASTIKYPVSSSEGNRKDGDVARKKFGYFCSESEGFSRIWKHLSIPENKRHPLTFLLEAADDIAYSANDLEDAVRKKIINSTTFLEKLEDFLDKNTVSEDDPLRGVHSRCVEIRKNDRSIIENCIVEKFRLEAHAEMIKSVVEAFTNQENYERIMEGGLTSELLMVSRARSIRQFFESFANKHVFSSNDVLMLELMGEEVISGLLEQFFETVKADRKDLEKTKSKPGKLYRLISEDLRFLHEEYSNKDAFAGICLINDYICGMTDSYALRTYRKLVGIEY